MRIVGRAAVSKVPSLVQDDRLSNQLDLAEREAPVKFAS